jgi:sugar phosphate isomerase/epimerase
MIGLSMTAIGQRPLSECLEIYEALKGELSLDYLELAVGTRCNLSLIPTDIPLFLHDRCLYEGAHKLPFALAEPESWEGYRQRIASRDVRLLSVHPPLRSEMSLDGIRRNRDALESLLGIPVCLEVMPSPHYWLSAEDFRDQPDALSDIPLLLDISHINLWAMGREAEVRGWVERLLPQAKAIHLSHNNGRSDSHDLIPAGIWFAESVAQWYADGLSVTYESLPVRFAQYERMDKQRRKGRVSRE